MITKNLTLWLGKQEKQLFVPVSQYDTMWTFVFTIINGSTEWTIPGSATVMLNGKKPDGNVFSYACTVSNNKASVDADVQMTAVAGDVECELSVTASSTVVGTANFILAVEPAPVEDGDVVSDSDVDAYGAIISDTVGSYLTEHPEIIPGKGLTEDVKTALLACFAKVAWTVDNGQDYYDALSAALNAKTVVSISAVFEQGGATIYEGASLDTLKQYLTVTATYDDASTATVLLYELSGTLTVGTSTITVTYEGLTTTFTVTVSSRYVLYDYLYNSYNGSGGSLSWVDTGLTYYPSFNTLDIELEAENDNTSINSVPLVCANNKTTSDTGNIVWYARANKGGFSSYNLGVAKQLNTVPGYTRAVCKYFFVDGGESYMQYGNTTVAVATVAKSSVATNNKTLMLMGGYAFSDGGQYSYGTSNAARLGYVKFTDPATDTLLYHFIPAYDAVTDKYGYWEDVNGVFYPDNSTYLRGGNWGA